MFLGRDNETQQYFVPTWLPTGMRLVMVSDEVTVDPFTASERNYEYRSNTTAVFNQRLRLTLRMPSFPATELFGEWVEIGDAKAILVHNLTNAHLSWMIGDCSVVLHGEELSALDLIDIGRSVRVAFDEFGPHLDHIQVDGLYELTQRRESRPVLHYLDESNHAQFALFTYESIPSNIEPNTVLSVAGMELPAHFSCSNSPSQTSFVWSDANAYSADIWEASLHNGDETTLRDILRKLEPVNRSEFAALEATIGTADVLDPSGRHVAGTSQLRDGSLVRYRYQFGGADTNEIAVVVSCRGHCFITSATPGPKPAFRSGLRMLGYCQAMALATSPTTGAVAHWPDGTSRAAEAFTLSDGSMLLVITRYDNEPPFLHATFTTARADLS
jgi:hypothetical protein